MPVCVSWIEGFDTKEGRGKGFVCSEYSAPVM